jgi:hypothetical protein
MVSKNDLSPKPEFRLTELIQYCTTKSKMTKLKPTKHPERLRNIFMQQPLLHETSHEAKCHDDISADKLDSPSHLMIELRWKFLNISIKQTSEAFGVDRRDEEPRIVCANENSSTAIYKKLSFHRPISELRKAKGSCCGIECTSRAKTQNMQTSVTEGCSCMYSLSEGIGTTQCRSLYVGADKFRPVIHPLDSKLLMSPPSPLEL